MNADGSDQRRLTQSQYDETPTWSPDGTKIAFWHLDSITMSSSWGIFVMNADGSDQRAVASTSNSSLGQPAWSPDGLKFAVADLGTYGISLINVDGSNRTQITQAPPSFPTFADHDPAWSPDGSKITFIRCDDSNDYGCDTTSHLWGVNADGSNPTKLTDTLAYTHAWSPDGTKIIVGNAQDSGGDLLVMNPDGSGLTNITNTNDEDERSPSWQPLPLTLLNPIDDPQVFVRQQYRDFLNREPDPGGLAYWTDQITPCGSDALCVHNRRIDVSAAFFHSLEFQQTGSFVYGLYKGALGRQPSYPEFTVDHNRVIGGTNLDDEKIALANDFVQRPEFLQHYPSSITNAQFVNTLFDTAGLVPFAAERQAEIDAMNNQGRTRAQVLRNVIDIQAFRDREFNPSFVLMQYFGYLRRDVDPGGYAFWLNALNGGGSFRGMVCAFITSSEYQFRFGSVATRSNADCSQ
jgi:hypothetical protein